MGKDFDQLAKDGKRTLAETIQRTVFPFFQGTPNFGAIAGTDEFKHWARLVVQNAAALAGHLAQRQYRVLTGGTDNHMVLIDVYSRGLTGTIAERALEECHVITNKNRIPGDKNDALTASGLRLGTNALSSRGMRPKEMKICADLIAEVLCSTTVLDRGTYHVDPKVKRWAQDQVSDLCEQFPIPNYPLMNRFELNPIPCYATD